MVEAAEAESASLRVVRATFRIDVRETTTVQLLHSDVRACCESSFRPHHRALARFSGVDTLADSQPV
jgi:hypothetical protein